MTVRWKHKTSDEVIRSRPGDRLKPQRMGSGAGAPKFASEARAARFRSGAGLRPSTANAALYPSPSASGGTLSANSGGAANVASSASLVSPSSASTRGASFHDSRVRQFVSFLVDFLSFLPSLLFLYLKTISLLPNSLHSVRIFDNSMTVFCFLISSCLSISFSFGLLSILFFSVLSRGKLFARNLWYSASSHSHCRGATAISSMGAHDREGRDTQATCCSLRSSSKTTQH